MELSEYEKELCRELLVELAELVLTNKKPIAYLDNIQGIGFCIGGAMFLIIQDGELKPIDLMRRHIDINTIPYIQLDIFIKSFKFLNNEAS